MLYGNANFLFILFGIISLKDIGNDKLPRLRCHYLVITAYDGANPKVVDRSVTSILESSCNTVTGLDNIKSNSTIGLSVVTLTFEIKNIDTAFSEVQEKISQTLRNSLKMLIIFTLEKQKQIHNLFYG